VPSPAKEPSVDAQANRRPSRARPARLPALARLLLASLVLLASTATAVAQADPRRAGSNWSAPWTRWAGSAPQKPHPAVARIIVPERDGTSLGSGTLVDVTGDYGLVITNWHVVSDAAGVITVVFPDGFRSAAQLVKTDRVWDLAALAVWKPNATPVPLAAAPPQPGEPLTIAGYGSGDYRAAAGRCTQYVAPDVNQPYEMVEVGTAARQGDSGGPIFNSRGELAGVLFGAGHGTTSGSYCGRVRGFLESVLPGAESASDATMIAARESPRPTRLSAVVPRAGTPPSAPATSLGDSRRLARSASQGVAAQQASRSPLEPFAERAATSEASAGQPAEGDSPFSQIKTFLAVVGGVAFLLRVLKFLSPRPKPDEESESSADSREASKRGRGKTK